MPKTETITPFAAKGETLPPHLPRLPQVKTYELCGLTPMYMRGYWFWTAYRHNLGYELKCDDAGRLIEAIRMPQIDCEEE